MLGEIPEYLQSCIDSVEHWAFKNGHDYIVLKDKDNPFKCPENASPYQQFLWNRHAADWMRLKELSLYEYTLYVDWDMYIHNLTVPDLNKPCFACPNIIGGLIYNGTDTKLFSNLIMQLDQPSFNTHYKLMDVLRRHCKDPHQEFKGKFIHLDNCRYAKQYYV